MENKANELNQLIELGVNSIQQQDQKINYIQCCHYDKTVDNFKCIGCNSSHQNSECYKCDVPKYYECDQNSKCLCPTCFNNSVKNTSYYLYVLDQIEGPYSISQIVSKYVAHEISSPLWLKRELNNRPSVWFQLVIQADNTVIYDDMDTLRIHNSELIKKLETTSRQPLEPKLEKFRPPRKLNINVDILDIPIIAALNGKSTKCRQWCSAVCIMMVFLIQICSLALVLSKPPVIQSMSAEIDSLWFESNATSVYDVNNGTLVISDVVNNLRYESHRFVNLLTVSKVFGHIVLLTYIAFLCGDAVNVLTLFRISAYVPFVTFLKGGTYCFAMFAGSRGMELSDSNFDVFANVLAVFFILELDDWVGKLWLIFDDGLDIEMFNIYMKGWEAYKRGFAFLFLYLFVLMGPIMVAWRSLFS